MTKDQILQLVKEHFKYDGLSDDGSCFKCKYYGDTDTFVKFAEMIYNQGKYDGYERGYDAAYCEHGGY